MSLLDPTITAAPPSLAPPARAGDAAPAAGQGPVGRRRVAFVVLACLAGAALTLLAPSSPTYDPWSWIVWGREILHLDLMTTSGPSWKPLPMVFIVPFSLLGSAAPALWLVIARAAALLSLVIAFRLARRLGGGQVVAGVVAVCCLVLAPWYLRNVWLGNSEGLMVVCLLGAVLAHLEGRRRGAFGWGVAAALLRPEAWPFLGLYGLWFVWRERDRLLLVAAGFASLPVLWFLPELWGSGNLLRAAQRAQQPRADAATFSDSPILTILDTAARMLSVPAYLGLAVALAWLLLRRGERSSRVAVGGILVMALAWIALVAYMTSDGFSGSERYLVAPVALLAVCAGAGAGWAFAALPLRATGLVAATVVAGLAVLAPGASELDRTVSGMVHQSRLPGQLSDVIARAGGKERLLACGAPVTGPLLVPQVAYELGIHTSAVTLDPRPGSVVFRVRTTLAGGATPPLTALGGTGRTLATAKFWRVVASCRPGAGA